VVYTMYYQDSIIAIQKQEIDIWRDRHARQKKYSDSSDLVRAKAVSINNQLIQDNKSLKTSRQDFKRWLLISLSANAVFIAVIFF